MRLLLLTALTMVAFAANSVLNRLALAEGAIGPAGFAAIRVASGATVLLVLLSLREKAFPAVARPNLVAVGGLSLYMLGFSYAYVAMDAGLGALILFGGVQLTMFLGVVLEGERPPAQRWAGAALALGGLAVLTWPAGGAVPPPLAVVLMVLGAFGWGVYSLVGRGSADPLRDTGWNFVYSLPIVGFALIFATGEALQAKGVVLAMLSGGITSALGYALWYSLLSQLGATRGALAQLSAPVLALAMGAVFLGEAVTLKAVLSAALILGGVALGVAPLGGKRR